MNYERIRKALFLERPNRFIAYADVDGRRETVHVKNTGRCAELLIPGAVIYIQESANPARKTKWDLIAVEKGDRLINMDSQVPNLIVREWIEKGNLFRDITLIRPETTFGNSRFDLYVETQSGRKAFVEVKGVTLEENNIARFPDAPTERGVKHVRELIRCVQDGYEAYLLFVIQMKGIRLFQPNWKTHADFGNALREAENAGVKILAYDCLVGESSLEIQDLVPIDLEEPVC